MDRTIVLTPTYNERDNIQLLATRILALQKRLHILIIDDNSPDGTGMIADDLASKHKDISISHRPGKAGLGKAYIAGFNHALANGYDNIITMDADLSHDPEYLPLFLEALTRNDVAVGTRYIRGAGVENWPLWRRGMSRGASIYTRLITGIPLHDVTGGYNGYRRMVLEPIHPEEITARGYSFIIEMKYRSWKAGFSFKEIPIIFVDRAVGKSKMRKRIFIEAIFAVWRLRRAKLV
jgi:dolichol-phosphate mannosyltransferase